MLNPYKYITVTPPEKHPWKIPISEPETLSTDLIRYIHGMAEERLKGLLSVAEDIVSRSFNLTAFLIALSTAMLGFGLDKVNDNRQFAVIAFIGFAYTFLAMLYGAANLFYKEYFVSGSKPSEVLTKDNFSDAIRSYEDKSLPEKYLYLTEIEAMETSIVHNAFVNRRRAKIYSVALTATMLTPLVLLVAWAILSLSASCPA